MNQRMISKAMTVREFKEHVRNGTLLDTVRLLEADDDRLMEKDYDPRMDEVTE